MKKYLKYSLCIAVFSTLYSCSSDDTNSEAVIEKPLADASIAIKLEANYSTTQYKVVDINPEVNIENSNGAVPQYKWSVKVAGKDGVVSDSIIGNSKNLNFIVPKAADYVLDYTVTLNKLVKQASTKVAVSGTGLSYHAKALSIMDYVPSPCFNLGDYEFATKAETLEQIKDDLNNGSSAPLGTFGGYIVVGFDHTVINSYGKRDFAVRMINSNNVKFSPVSIYVAYDKNKNGVPDANEWYEIAGSEYSKSSTVKNYEVTYYKPNPDKAPVAGTLEWQFDKEYLKWSDNKGVTSTITKTERWQYNNYYPSWMGDSYTTKGTKVSLPVKDVSDGSGIKFNVGTFEWGYGGIKDPSIDISWAVDSNGNKVHLPGVDFVKVYVPTLIEIGASDLLTNFFKEVEDLNFTTGK